MIDSEDAARAFCAAHSDGAGLARLEKLGAMLAVENEQQNLVAARSLESIWQRHFADSLQLLQHVPSQAGGPWLDLGSGAGFPGLAIAAVRPDMPVVLIESRKRRAEWLSRAAADLGLVHCSIIAKRLEAVPSFPAAVISARAFAPLTKLLGLSARFSTHGTVWLLPKGRNAAQELREQPAEVRAMFHVEQSQTDPSGGIIVGNGALTR